MSSSWEDVGYGYGDEDSPWSQSTIQHHQRWSSMLCEYDVGRKVVQEEVDWVVLYRQLDWVELDSIGLVEVEFINDRISFPKSLTFSASHRTGLGITCIA